MRLLSSSFRNLIKLAAFYDAEVAGLTPPLTSRRQYQSGLRATRHGQL